ncbi:hypothetical protein TKK_0009271 [Trichogramma kaykai]|uniref:Uncharacterized protein n=1 Tax=Trichogramma kaykai TaxID=54128 RepID=A0ABD2X369_9HYME
MRRFVAIVIASLSVVIIVGPNDGSAAASANNDDDFPRKQSAIFQLLWQSSGASGAGSPAKSHPEIFERVKNYKLDDVVEACNNKTLARELEAYMKFHRADKSRVVSYYRDEDIEAIRSLANVLVDARSFDDFVTIAAWSDDQWDELAWIHALAIALQRREDCRGLRTPNLWEIAPNYFFGADVVLQSYMMKTGEMSRPDNTIVVVDDAESDSDTEQSVLAYYLEDVGLNEFYFNFASSRPHWLPAIDEQRQTFGELYYHVHKMLLAKYRLEMSAANVRKPDVEHIDWERPIAIGYKSDMIHHNGRLVPGRVAGTNLPARSYAWLEDAKHYESRLAMSLDSGVMNSYISNRLTLSDPRHFDDFCNVLEGNRATLDLRYFGSVERLYRRLLGSHVKHLPASIEMPMTCSRDPAFYRLIKRIVDFGEQYKSRLEPYSLAELTYDAVRVDYVHLDDNLHTRFEAYESYVNHRRRDLRSTTDSGGNEHRNHHQQQRQAQQSSSSSSSPHTVKVRRTRLQSRPFDYEIGVHADSPARAVVVRLFLGPERDEFGREFDPLTERHRFYEIDRWLLDLKAGMNKIVRSSAEAVYYAPEPVSSAAYSKLVARAVRGVGDSDGMSKPLRHALPGRLILPRGTADGLRVQLFVCLHPAPEENKIHRYRSALFEGLLLDGRSLGFPLDRRVSDDVLPKFQNVKNCMLKPVRIFNDDKSQDADDADP